MTLRALRHCLLDIDGCRLATLRLEQCAAGLPRATPPRPPRACRRPASPANSTSSRSNISRRSSGVSLRASSTMVRTRSFMAQPYHRSPAISHHRRHLGRGVEVLRDAAQAEPLQEAAEARIGGQHGERDRPAGSRRSAAGSTRTRPARSASSAPHTTTPNSVCGHRVRAAVLPRQPLRVARLAAPHHRLAEQQADHEDRGADGRHGALQEREHQLDRRAGHEAQPAAVAAHAARVSIASSRPAIFGIRYMVKNVT